MSFEKLIRNDLLDLLPYASARSEKLTGNIWLNANESPWGNAEDDGISDINRYPEQQPEQLIARLAAYNRVNVNQVLVSRGSDEGIDLLLRLFCNARLDSIAALDPTFGMYKICAKIQGVKYTQLGLNKENNYSIDINSIDDQLSEKTKILFLCHPNNPTGNLLNKEKVIALCKRLENKCILVIDEAYIEFSEDSGFTQYVSEFKNLVVLKTMSKAFGLASARVGIMISNDKLIAWIKKLLAPYPISKPAALAAISALSKTNLDLIGSQIKVIILEREKLRLELCNLNIVHKVWPSQANFLLVEFSCRVMDLCLKQGVVIRSMSKIIGCDKTYRITIGSVDENSKILSIFKKLNELKYNE